jgi:hypothetical protein
VCHAGRGDRADQLDPVQVGSDVLEKPPAAAEEDRHLAQLHRVDKPRVEVLLRRMGVARFGSEGLGTNYRYTTCRAGHYYVGCIGTPCIHPTRQPPIWTLTKDTRTLECCLRSQGELGWEVELYRNGTVYGVRRFVLRAEALVFAAVVRGDCEREGWV